MTLILFPVNCCYWWQADGNGLKREKVGPIFKIPNVSCPQLNSKNNGLRLSFKAILWHLFCFLSFVATDGKDGNGLKREKVGPSF